MLFDASCSYLSNIPPLLTQHILLHVRIVELPSSRANSLRRDMLQICCREPYLGKEVHLWRLKELLGRASFAFGFIVTMYNSVYAILLCAKKSIKAGRYNMTILSVYFPCSLLWAETRLCANSWQKTVYQ